MNRESYNAIVESWDAARTTVTDRERQYLDAFIEEHVDRAEHEALIGRMARLLVEGAPLMLTVGGSAHPAFTDTMFDQHFFYDSHPPEKTLELLLASGFVPLVADFINQPTGGRDKGRYAIVARRVS